MVGEHDKGYLKHFWSGYSPDKNPFRRDSPPDLPRRGESFSPKRNPPWFAEKFKSTNPAINHLVVAEVLSGLVQEEEAKPAIHLRKSGLKY